MRFPDTVGIMQPGSAHDHYDRDTNRSSVYGMEEARKALAEVVRVDSPPKLVANGQQDKRRHKTRPLEHAIKV